MKKIKYFILLFLVSLFLSGCVGAIAVAGTATGAAFTAQEVDEDYDGDFVDYLSDRFDKLNRYLKSKSSD